MGCRLSKVLRGVGRVGVTVGLTVVLVTSSGRLGMAQSNESGSGEGLAGAWMVEVTLRNCQSGAALGPAFHSLVTFHRGGTISESAGTLAFAPGQRTSGHGQWSRDRGHTYTQRMIALVLFDTPANPPVSPGFFAGWTTVTHTIELTDANHLTSAGTNAFYMFDGTLYRTGCSTAVGQRFK